MWLSVVLLLGRDMLLLYGLALAHSAEGRISHYKAECSSHTHLSSTPVTLVSHWQLCCSQSSFSSLLLNGIRLLTAAIFVLTSEPMVLAVTIFGAVGASPLRLSRDTWTRHQTWGECCSAVFFSVQESTACGFSVACQLVKPHQWMTACSALSFFVISIHYHQKALRYSSSLY